MISTIFTSVLVLLNIYIATAITINDCMKENLRYYLPPFGCFEPAPWKDNYDYWQAKWWCKNRNLNGSPGHLFEPTNDHLQFLITGLLLNKEIYDKGWWIGANEYDYVGEFFTWDINKTIVKLDDYKTFQYWNKGEPDLKEESKQYCVKMLPLYANHYGKFNKWAVELCSNKLNYPLCHYEMNSTQSLYRGFAYDPEQRYCPDHWLNLGPHGCFHFGFHLKPMNYYQARLYCQHLYPGTSLAEITSNVTQYLITGAMAYYGIDFVYKSWWIGSSRTKSGEFYWEKNSARIDGEPWDATFTNWQPGEPNNKNGQEDCVHLLPIVWKWGKSNHQWNDARCIDFHYPLCQLVT